MRIFLSHKKEDTDQAESIASYLRVWNIPYYLDSLDDTIVDEPVRLTEHLKRLIEQSTHLMAVVSRKTQASWWVPFEIGLAAECGDAISTYLLESVQLPGYLVPWPYLRSRSDLQHYVTLAHENLLLEQYVLKDSATKRADATSFEKRLKQKLGQS